jgi:uncharacterized protein involved in exopolysaccharide biosynthesis
VSRLVQVTRDAPPGVDARTSDASAPAMAAPRERDDSVPVLELVNALLRQRRSVAWLAFAGALIAGAVTLMAPRQYRAVASFVPQAGGQPTALSGLAAQFGVNVPVASTEESPQFYAELVDSRAILRTLIGDSALASLVPGGLAAHYEIQVRDSLRRREATLRHLEEAVSSAMSPRTGVITVTVLDRDPAAAHAILRRLVRAVDAFNRERRQSRASAERAFVEMRLGEARAQLEVAERRLLGFLQQNRGYGNSPSLQFERDRLQHEVSMRQQLYTSLAQAYDQARIDEVRNTPVITTVQEPERPALPEPRRLPFKVLLGGILGAVLGMVLGFVREFARRAGTRATESREEFLRLRRETWLDLTRPWRLLGLGVRGSSARVS